ncbi:GntR family transcriptional regulator [Nesterenkonia alkaliphila]|uniref:FCD domain-containing protein n=1 Tax=Nesterenkonia alkaliphila TaxID=1463631 RepID=A0A7K1UHV8_9MICC|nr:GntR family transcriptional regulator [Nesterenkonia alkaliphila]MVT25964.1 FCD domain-containing protein [Nesterenkonia alkaliphila]GFZ95668.1 GntR family transcriptional regulator [Nesterenkonia alkaliphila]
MTPAPGVRRYSGADYVYSTLREQIISLELPPGQRLRETALAQQMKVSRTPVREALSRLLSENLVEQGPTGGTFVTPLDLEDLRELYLIRSALESVSAREAAQHASPADLAEMADLLEQMERLLDRESETHRLGALLHDVIFRAAGIHRSDEMLRQIRGHLHRYRILSNQSASRREEAFAEHRHIVDAIASRDPDAAEQAIREHVMAAYQEVKAHLQARESAA